MSALAMPASTPGYSSDLAVPVAIRTLGVSKVFGTTPALVQVDLEVVEGALVTVVGGNGAGKTTLLRIVATALRPSAGTVEIFGCDAVRTSRTVRAGIDYVSTAGGAYPELSARENLRFATGMRGLHASDRDIDRALSRAGLEADADEPVRAFSSGMLRRLAIARLVLTRPRLALLDEPYANMDDDGRALVDELVDELRGAGGTVVLATHERERATRLADGVVELHRGLVVARGSAEPLAAVEAAR